MIIIQIIDGNGLRYEYETVRDGIAEGVHDAGTPRNRRCKVVSKWVDARLESGSWINHTCDDT